MKQLQPGEATEPSSYRYNQQPLNNLPLNQNRFDIFKELGKNRAIVFLILFTFISGLLWGSFLSFLFDTTMIIYTLPTIVADCLIFIIFFSPLMPLSRLKKGKLWASVLGLVFTYPACVASQIVRSFLWDGNGPNIVWTWTYLQELLFLVISTIRDIRFDISEVDLSSYISPGDRNALLIFVIPGVLICTLARIIFNIKNKRAQLT